LQGLLPLPGEHDEDPGLTPRGSLEPITGLQEAKAPLPHLRCRNALKIINDLDLGFGRVKAPHPEGGVTSWIGGIRRQ
jgi:solute carrier family 25 aspartate/glutamate transporter 12/13